MKTSEEIKEALECCVNYGGCSVCSYSGKNCVVELSTDALEYIKQLEAQVPKWISVEERLPEPETEVLVWLRHIPNIAVYGHDKYGNLDFYFIDECGYRGTFRPAVTHWMPLPSTEEINNDT